MKGIFVVKGTTRFPSNSSSLLVSNVVKEGGNEEIVVIKVGLGVVGKIVLVGECVVEMEEWNDGRGVTIGLTGLGFNVEGRVVVTMPFENGCKVVKEMCEEENGVEVVTDSSENSAKGKLSLRLKPNGIISSDPLCCLEDVNLPWSSSEKGKTCWKRSGWGFEENVSRTFSWPVSPFIRTLIPLSPEPDGWIESAIQKYWILLE